MAAGAVASLICTIGLAVDARTPANAIGAVALGAGFALNAGLLATERGRISVRTEATSLESIQFSSCLDVEALAGLAAVVLGVLSVIEAAVSLVLMAVLVLGIAAICASGILMRLNAISGASTSEPTWHIARDRFLAFATTSQSLAGIGAIGMAMAGVIGSGGLFAAAAMVALAAASILGSTSVITHLRSV